MTLPSLIQSRAVGYAACLKGSVKGTAIAREGCFFAARSARSIPTPVASIAATLTRSPPWKRASIVAVIACSISDHSGALIRSTPAVRYFGPNFASAQPVV